jgi:hypothetical protein
MLGDKMIDIKLENGLRPGVRHSDLKVGEAFVIRDAAIQYVYVKTRNVEYRVGGATLKGDALNLNTGNFYSMGDTPLLKVKVAGKAVILDEDHK